MTPVVFSTPVMSKTCATLSRECSTVDGLSKAGTWRAWVIGLCMGMYVWPRQSIPGVGALHIWEHGCEVCVRMSQRCCGWQLASRLARVPAHGIVNFMGNRRRTSSPRGNLTIYRCRQHSGSCKNTPNKSAVYTARMQSFCVKLTMPRYLLAPSGSLASPCLSEGCQTAGGAVRYSDWVRSSPWRISRARVYASPTFSMWSKKSCGCSAVS